MDVNVASCLYFFNSGIEGVAESRVSLTGVVTISAGHEYREWVAKSHIYLYVTDDGTGN